MTESNWNLPEPAVLTQVHTSLETHREDSESPDVLATIVNVEGNAYRRPGAKMLFDSTGSHVGSLTPGCLEDELQTAAERVRTSGTTEYVRYDMMDDDDVWGLGVGCHGIIDVLVEPLSEAYRPAVSAFLDREDIAVLTVIDETDKSASALSRGDRAYYYPADDRFVVSDGSADNWPIAELKTPAKKLATHGRSTLVTIPPADNKSEETELTVFVDGIAARPALVIFGSGHDVAPVTELASKNEFHVTVVGFRGGVSLTDRFPFADETITTSPRALDDVLAVDDRTYTVVMTHNFVDDQLVVETLLSTESPYIGVMGPRERFERIHTALNDSGTQVSEDALEAVYTPIGLNLGGGSPYQIAHSIVAELLAVHNDRTPEHLKSHAGPIHGRAAKDILNADE